MIANIPGIVRVLALGGERVRMAIINRRIVYNHAKPDVTAAKGNYFSSLWQGTDRLEYQHDYYFPYFVLVLNRLYNYPCTYPFKISYLCYLRYCNRPLICANA